MTTRRAFCIALAAIPIAGAVPAVPVIATTPIIDPSFPYTIAEIERMPAAVRELVHTVSLWPDAATRDWRLAQQREAENRK